MKKGVRSYSVPIQYAGRELEIGDETRVIAKCLCNIANELAAINASISTSRQLDQLRDNIAQAASKEQLPVSVLQLSTRPANALWVHGVATLGQLATYSVEELLRLRQMGMKGATEIASALRKFGFSLPEGATAKKG